MRTFKILAFILGLGMVIFGFADQRVVLVEETYGEG